MKLYDCNVVEFKTQFPSMYAKVTIIIVPLVFFIKDINIPTVAKLQSDVRHQQHN